jgi:hypothetical protein
MNSGSADGGGHRRDFLKRVTHNAFAVGAASSGVQFIGEPPPAADGNKPPPGFAADVAINMALLDSVNPQFAEELSDFRGRNNEPWVHWSSDFNVLSIDVGPGQSRAFRKIHSAVDPGSGGKVVVFQEIAWDASRNLDAVDAASAKAVDGAPLRILFPGLSDGGDGLGDADAKAIHQLLSGRRSPQIEFVKSQMAKTIIPLIRSVRRADGSPVPLQILGHSLGAGNAIQAKQMLMESAIRGECTTVLFEPFAAALEASYVLNDLRDAGRSADLEATLVGLSRDTHSIRSFPPTFEASLYLGNAIANKPFGDRYYTIDHPESPEARGKAAGVAGVASVIGASKLYRSIVRTSANAKPVTAAGDVGPGHQLAVSRRDFGKAAAAGIAGASLSNLVVYSTGKGFQKADSRYHDLALSASLLMSDGNTALVSRSSGGVMPTMLEIDSPGDFKSYEPQIHAINLIASQMTNR